MLRFRRFLMVLVTFVFCHSAVAQVDFTHPLDVPLSSLPTDGMRMVSAISDDGMQVFVGYPEDDELANNAGTVFIYDYVDG